MYSGKGSERLTAPQKPISSALIGLVAESSHDLRESIRTRSDGTRRTYTSLTCCSGVRKPLGSRRRHRNRPDVFPILNRDQTTRIFSTVWNLLLLVFGVTSQVDDFDWRMVLLVFRGTWHHWRRRHRRRCIGQPRSSGNHGSFIILILGAISLA